jgi:3-keto-disaccharide hydrolase
MSLATRSLRGAAALCLGIAALASGGPAEAPNTLSAKERAEGFRLLWDGTSTRGWRAAKGKDFPASGWEIKDGALSVVESGGAESRAGGDIVTEASFAAFDLRFEFRLTPGANSGVKYYVDTELNKAEGSAIGLEFQLLDDARHPDAKQGREGNRTLASLYDLIPAAASKPTRPIGEWNEARIVADGRHVEHWLNGAKVLEYERGSQAFRTLVAASKYKVWPAFGERPSGKVLLQDHGNRVSFRSLRIRELKPR